MDQYYDQKFTQHITSHSGIGGRNQRKAKAQTSVKGGHAVRHIKTSKSSLLHFNFIKIICVQRQKGEKTSIYVQTGHLLIESL